mgnify:CR=1 FL=1
MTATASAKQGETYRFRGNVFPDFRKSQFNRPVKLAAPEAIHPEAGNIRQNQWKLVDFDGDGAIDLTVGIDFWGDYGWDAAFNPRGEWTRGPLHGYVYLLRNTGTTAKPVYAAPEKVMAGVRPVDPFGMPSPMWGDFDGDGDVDQADFGRFQACFSGSGTGYGPGCEVAAGRQTTASPDLKRSGPSVGGHQS